MKKIIKHFAALGFVLGLVAPVYADNVCNKTVSMGTSIADDFNPNCLSTHRMDTSDPYNPHATFAKFYTFTLSRNADIKAVVTAGFDTQLYLLNGATTQGQPVLVQNGGTLETYLVAGTYTLEVTNRFTQSYTFSLSFNDLGSQQCVQPITPGVPISDGWVPACESNHRDVVDPYTPNPDFGFRAKYFTFSLTQDTDVRIMVESSKDTYVYMLDGLGEFAVPLAQYDNLPVLTALPAGNYTIEVTTNRRYAPGTFTVSLDTLNTDPLCTSALQFGQQATGTWSNNCLIQSWDNSNTDPYAGRNPERAKYYTFSLQQPTDVMFSNISGDSPTVLNLFAGNGFTQLIKSNKSTDYFGRTTLLSSFSTRLESGTYTLEVTSYDQTAIGGYRFSTSIFDNGLCQNLITASASLQGLIDRGCFTEFRRNDSGDPYSPRPGEYFAKRFEFDLASAGAYVFSLFNDSADAYMYLARKDSLGQLTLITESLHEPLRSSRVAGIASVLDAGTYVLEVTTELPGATTRFNLNIRSSNSGDCAFYVNINQAISSTINAPCASTFKPSLPNPDPYGSPRFFTFYSKHITFNVGTAGEYTLSTVAAGFNPHLFLVAGTDVDGAVLLDQSYPTSTGTTVVNLQPGFYTVELTSAQSSTSGSFSFQVSNGDSVPIGCNHTLTGAGEQIYNGVWTVDCVSQSRPGSYAGLYDFTLSATSTVQIDLISSIDNYLYLLRETNGTWSPIAENDDSGAGYNASLNVLLQPGRYRIEATTFSDNVVGDYQLVVKGNFATDTDSDGVPDNLDQFPNDPSRSRDTDTDGYDDLVDNDDDNDGVLDINDAFPLDSSEYQDSDNDGIGDNSDITPYHTGGVVNIKSTQYDIDEDTSSVVVTIERSNYQFGTSSVGYSTSDGTAVANVHYKSKSGFLVFQEGETSKQVSIEIINDSVFTGDRSFNFTIASVSGANAGTNLRSTINILEDEEFPVGGLVAWSDSSGEYDEASGTINIGVQRIGPADREVSVSFATKDGRAVAGNDYLAQSGMLTFLPGETEKYLQVTLIDDAQREETEFFNLELSNPTGGAVLEMNAQSRVVIVDNDQNETLSEIGFTQSQVKVKEKAGVLGLRVDRTGNTADSATVDWIIAGGRATAGEDYQKAEGTLSFDAGETTKFINIGMLGDDVYEPDEEFTVKLLSPSEQAVITNSEIEVTIVNDDEPPLSGVITLSGARYVVNENGGKAYITINRDFYSDLETFVEYITLPESARDGVDYEGDWRYVVFAAGESSKVVEINILDDEQYEGTESFIFRLADTKEFGIPLGEFTEASIQIKDDDPAPVSGAIRFSGNEYTARETDGVARVTLQRLHGYAGEISVVYRTTADTAQEGVNFKPKSGIIYFEEGETSKIIEIDILDNGSGNGNSSFDVELVQPMGAVIEGNKTARVTITDVKPSNSGGGSFELWMIGLSLLFLWLLSPQGGVRRF